MTAGAMRSGVRFRSPHALAWAAARLAEQNAALGCKNQELERKNEELQSLCEHIRLTGLEVKEKNRRLEDLVQEMSKRNEALLASHHQADRIFSAFTQALPGTVLDGKYRLEEKIGTGGFGAVFKATHLGLNRPVAVKVFRPTAGNDSPEAVERFRREGISACRVNHPNAVAVLDSGISEAGISYLVMELLEGRSLAAELKIKGRLSLRRCAEILKPVCEVLAAAHAAGIVHRDIKPDNIFLHRGKDGEVVKVVDFGIAKLVGEYTGGEGGDLTATGGIIGTPAYMAPERLAGRQYDGQADVYSLGVMLYEMLCGRSPVQASGKDILQIIAKLLIEPPPSLRTHLPHLPEAVDAVVMQALSKQADSRPAAGELAEEFSRAVAGSYPVQPLATAPHDLENQVGEAARTPVNPSDGGCLSDSRTVVLKK